MMEFYGSEAMNADRNQRAPVKLTAKTPPSAACEGQPERGHLLAVAGQQDVADQYRVVPGLALERPEPRELRELVRGRPDKSQLTLLRPAGLSAPVLNDHHLRYNALPIYRSSYHFRLRLREFQRRERTIDWWPS